MVRWWPVSLREGNLVLRPLQRSDAAAYREVRATNSDWLQPWEATSPEQNFEPLGFHELRRILNANARKGLGLPFAIEVDGSFRGQVTVSGIQWGSLRSAQIGYWIDQRVAGRGHTPTAVALAADYALFEVGLHRVEINIRPENAPSLRVVEKLGFRDEGLRAKYMHINGQWADHRTFALLAEDAPFGVLSHLKRNQAAGGV